MKVTMIYGNSLKGITYHYGQMFESKFPKETVFEEFYTSDLPGFCFSCKNCIIKGQSFCPEAEKTQKIMESMLSSDFIVFCYPTYALNVPASIKSLLDHTCYAWLVHRPELRMFSKKVIILTNSVGLAFQQKQAIKSVKCALSWMGVSYIKAFPIGMMGDIIWKDIKPESIELIDRNANKAYAWAMKTRNKSKMKLGTALKFKMCKMMHYSLYKSSSEVSLDNQHFLDHHWMKSAK